MSRNPRSPGSPCRWSGSIRAMFTRVTQDTEEQPTKTCSTHRHLVKWPRSRSCSKRGSCWSSYIWRIQSFWSSDLVPVFLLFMLLEYEMVRRWYIFFGVWFRKSGFVVHVHFADLVVSLHVGLLSLCQPRGSCTRKVCKVLRKGYLLCRGWRTRRSLLLVKNILLHEIIAKTSLICRATMYISGRGNESVSLFQVVGIGDMYD